MNITSAQLGELIAELHELNEELAEAARPLDRLPNLNDEQRDGVAARLRSGLARWEIVTRRIDEVLGGWGKGGGEKAPAENVK
jgi:hypothetical protein